MPALHPSPLAALVVLTLVLATGPVRAGEAETADLTWRDCLGRAYLTGAALSGPDLAADAALRACRGEEMRYLTALSASPLLDEEDIARARPALAARARARLLDGPRSVMR